MSILKRKSDRPSRSEPPAGQVEAGEEAASRSDPGWFRRLRQGLAKSSQALGGGINTIVAKRKLDEETLQELEDILIQADLGVRMASRIVAQIGNGRYDKHIGADDVKAILADEIARKLAPLATPLVIDTTRKPFVILGIGVNGSGKTTTIGKLAARFTREGHAVMLAAGDTFRAAAVEQLEIWGERIGIPVIAGKSGADASGLAFEALKRAREAETDILIIDTAGRLHNKAELMAQLGKIVHVLGKPGTGAPHSVLLALDATTGQNALNQVEMFNKTATVTGLVMNKLDGTARGGILVAVAERFALPIHFIGVGEGVDDLQPFGAEGFARAMAGIE